jgi:ABC-type sugar transport system ATPase subunit
VIQVRQLCVQAGGFRVENISFDIASGQYGVLMGRTGSGKTTILESICGLRRIGSGSIRLNGREVTNLKASERGIGYVPQDRAVFQTMSVWENLAFALHIRRWPPADCERRVRELAELLGIGYLLNRMPQGLSGGESQRVALGRALAFRPAILCLDEPLSALDDDTREEIYGLLETVQEQTGVTTLHITHHRGEAERLGDKIVLLQNGQAIEQTNRNHSP